MESEEIQVPASETKSEARHGIRTLYSLCFETAERLDLHLFATALPAHNVITYQMNVPRKLILSWLA